MTPHSPTLWRQPGSGQALRGSTLTDSPHRQADPRRTNALRHAHHTPTPGHHLLLVPSQPDNRAVQAHLDAPLQVVGSD